MGSAGTRDLEVGNSRRTPWLIKRVEDLSARPTGSIPVASGGWAKTKAAYRWLGNLALDWREFLEVGRISGVLSSHLTAGQSVTPRVTQREAQGNSKSGMIELTLSLNLS